MTSHTDGWTMAVVVATRVLTFWLGLALGYQLTGMVLGPGVLAVLAGLALGAVLLVLLERSRRRAHR